MSQWHLRDLENALTRRGWRVAAVLPGDDYRIAATWELQRSTRRPHLLLDFDGLDKDGDHCLPLERAYGCQARDWVGASLYFCRSRARWRKELAAFVAALDHEANDDSGVAVDRPPG